MERERADGQEENLEGIVFPYTGSLTLRHYLPTTRSFTLTPNPPHPSRPSLPHLAPPPITPGVPKTLSPQSSPPTWRPATTAPIQKATGPPPGRAPASGHPSRAFPASQPAPAIGTRVRWPAAPAPGIVLRSPQGAVPGGAAASPGSQVAGSPSLGLCSLPGTDCGVPRASVPALQAQRSPPPDAVLPPLGNPTLPPGFGFPKTTDLQILRMAF